MYTHIEIHYLIDYFNSLHGILSTSPDCTYFIETSYQSIRTIHVKEAVTNMRVIIWN